MFKTILVPVDLGETALSKAALDRACAMATLSGGSVRLIYIRTLVPMTYMEFVPADFDVDQQTQSKTALEALAATLPLPSDRVSITVRAGAIYAEVLAEAEQAKVDLIVIGSHRPAMATYLIGSNAARIVRHAPCSVLVVRDEG